MNEKKGTECIRVAVTVPVRDTFSYLVPEQLSPGIRVGCRVLVPFKKRKVTGYVLERIQENDDIELKAVLDVLDSEPLFPQKMVPFFEWLADYYFHPIGQVIQTSLPGGLNAVNYKSASLTKTGLKILEQLSQQTEQRDILSWIKDHPGKKIPWPVGKLYPLRKKGWLIIEERARRQTAGPLIRKFVRPKQDIELESILREKAHLVRAKNEEEFLKAIFDLGIVLLSDLNVKFTNAYYLVKKWTKENVIEQYEGSLYRDPAGATIFPAPTPPRLYGQQKAAVKKINECLDRKVFSPCLLYGVTGSGKTEVYFRSVEHAIRSGKKAILMVPEIALVTYLESIFRARLGNRIAVYHSRLSHGERYDQWIRMARGEVDMVIGARSALFAPFSELGIIIVDEEHDASYKQDTSPGYQARDAAVMRAKMENAVVLLGSGTPSVQSFQNSISKKYDLILMPDRVEQRPLPDVQIVDMKKLDKKNLQNNILSNILKDELEQNLADGYQSILFLNRRGFHRVFLCRRCGKTIHCPNCDVSLTHHIDMDRLTCHYCGLSIERPDKCPSCAEKVLKPYGFGTQKLEQELKTSFPDARVLRMDTDNTRKKGQIYHILKTFSDNKADMLIGTQMITKGYHFPKVTLVGIVAADSSLSFPDFRAGERTFQLLSQVAGRSGRGGERGRVIVQTFNPDHYAIDTATSHDYHTFFEREIALRKQLGYPPFSHLTCLRLEGNNKERTQETVEQLGLGIRAIIAKQPEIGNSIHLLGPVEAPIARLKGKYRWQILIKSKNISLQKYLLGEIHRLSLKMLRSSGVRLVIDVDPYQML